MFLIVFPPGLLNSYEETPLFGLFAVSWEACSTVCQEAGVVLNPATARWGVLPQRVQTGPQVAQW